MDGCISSGPVRWYPLGKDVRVHDNERRRPASARDVRTELSCYRGGGVSPTGRLMPDFGFLTEQKTPRALSRQPVTIWMREKGTLIQCLVYSTVPRVGGA